MSKFTDQLVEQQNAPRPKFEARCIRVTACSTLPIDAPLVFRVGLNIPGYSNGVYTTSDRAEAEQAAIGAIFCGAPYADINWMAGTVWHQQIWAEVS